MEAQPLLNLSGQAVQSHHCLNLRTKRRNNPVAQVGSGANAQLDCHTVLGMAVMILVPSQLRLRPRSS
eukprot:8077853-Alexandrium_andersonii.AAC.1